MGGFPSFLLESLSRKIPILTEVETTNYTPVNWNSNEKWTRIESMYFLLNMGIFQPAMLVYQRVIGPYTPQDMMEDGHLLYKGGP